MRLRSLPSSLPGSSGDAAPVVIPTVDAFRAAAKPAARRGRRSQVYMELHREAAPPRAEAEPKLSRSEILAKAREAKRAKHAGQTDGARAQPPIALAPTLALAPAPMAALKLDVAALARIARGHRSAFASSPIDQAISAAAALGVPASVPGLTEAFDEICRSPEMPMLSVSQRAQSLGIARQTMQDRMLKMGSSCVGSDHAAFRSLVKCLTESIDVVEPLMIIELAAYDETPMETTLKDVAFEVAPASAKASAGTLALHSQGMAHTSKTDQHRYGLVEAVPDSLCRCCDNEGEGTSSSWRATTCAHLWAADDMDSSDR